jgi:acyl-coenzyme A synthetase/AMP-(fatty) acid ligase
MLERWRLRTGRPLLDCYGCSETVFFVFASPAAGARPGSVGRPAPGVVAELRAPRGGSLDAEAGRLFLRHPFLAAGYGPLSRPRQARFADGWFETGDLFRRDADEFWRHCGRDDDLLKIAGQWVNLHEVEEAAAAAEDVALAAAVSAPDPDGLERIALFVTPEPRAASGALARRLESFLGERLPAHKRPKWLKVVAELPRTTTGKVRKAELRRALREGRP